MTAKQRGRLLRNRNWRYLWLGQGISQVGDYVFDVTLVLWVGAVLARGKPWAPEAVSGVLIAAAAPVLIIGPVAGVFVDRWDRRRTMLVADGIRALLVAALLAVPLVGGSWPTSVRLGLVYAAAALVSAIAQFFNPSRFAIIAAVVDEESRAQAFSLVQATSSTAAVVGPPLAAPLLFTVGVQWALVVNALSYVASFATVGMIRLSQDRSLPTTTHATFRAEFAAGLRFFARSRVLVALLVSLCIYTIGVGALNVLDIFFVTANLHVAASWLGVLSAAFGVGSVAGALIAGPVARRLTERRLYWCGLVATGLLVIGYSRSSALAVGVVVLALVGIPVGTVSAIASPLVLQATPQQMLGRVSAVINPLMQLAAIIAMAVAGLLASTVLNGMRAVVAGVTFGPIDTIFAVSGLLMVAAGVSVIGPLRATTAATEAAGQADQAVSAEAVQP
ncbi:MAG: MFS transporter [Streptosporangiaceae bacterium]